MTRALISTNLRKAFFSIEQDSGSYIVWQGTLLGPDFSLGVAQKSHIPVEYS